MNLKNIIHFLPAYILGVTGIISMLTIVNMEYSIDKAIFALTSFTLVGLAMIMLDLALIKLKIADLKEETTPPCKIT